MQKKYMGIALGLATLGSLALSTTAFAEDANAQTGLSADVEIHSDPLIARPVMLQSLFGTVTAVSGNTINMNGKLTLATTTTKTNYTIDATHATVLKANVLSTVSAIAVGDTILASGTLNGTNFIATMVRDGITIMHGKMGMMGGRGKDNNGDGRFNATTSPIAGNGEPIVLGTISSINGTTIVITNKSNVSYTVNAASSTIVQGKNKITTSDLKVGDSVVVQGAVNGTNITASSVIDQKVAVNENSKKGFGFGRIFGGLGSFFSHMFGF